MKSQKILIIEDDPDILEFVSFNLRKEGYEVFVAKDGVKGVQMCIQVQPDLVLLDVMMPRMDGVEVCELIRSNPTISNTIVAMLSARGEDYSQLAAFDAGADAYITKPIRPKLLVSKVKALLRRAGDEPMKQSRLERNGLVIDLERYTVEIHGKTLSLPRKEFELLALLAKKPGKVYARETIMEKVWGDEVVVGDRTIDVHIRKIREKIGDSRVRTVKGVGYTFEGES
ncbi:MAG TPA: DNA-binding response regulator [Cryomorphaceae bacterium]|jgi:two-component system alkaline phosphatase synthesis response regulator PhoP|nr:DNA-binding response regulator [Cryomorphaceae bacterium]